MLAWWHVVVAAVVVAAGVFFCYAYFFMSEPDDNLAGVALVIGVMALVLGASLLVLALAALRARRAADAYAFGMLAGLTGLIVVLPAAGVWLPRTSGAPVLGLVSLVLVASSVVALVRRVESPAGNL